jgi:hypothetical protein
MLMGAKMFKIQRQTATKPDVPQPHWKQGNTA